MSENQLIDIRTTEELLEEARLVARASKSTAQWIAQLSVSVIEAFKQPTMLTIEQGWALGRLKEELIRHGLFEEKRT